MNSKGASLAATAMEDSYPSYAAWGQRQPYVVNAIY
ncbi:MAG: hypothetical protein ACI92G_003015 [Candidatus Pelagisphaera sp.]|jgi:hypothetical protein